MIESTTKKEVANRETRELDIPRRQNEVVVRPPVDIYENSEGITLHLDMPGVSRDNLTVQADRDSLLVEGSAQIEMPEGMEALYADLRSTRYRRSFALSRDIATDKIDAAIKDGVVTIRIPKREEDRPRRIEIRAE